ncbi:filament-like plant protein 4 isoform X1 [Cannabis sativa]|uniref:filament-like plant protein 4 isoform X1 n=1 Tax=Cannabis sativa TaxID=3483 RepID=UPI0029C9B83D|nr:filament-like plant protein 4 isoform X1 [Cannabis sativa]XP_060962647.1 filament-like plant protein 4 isoform X1 [Cannabis sativa]
MDRRSWPWKKKSSDKAAAEKAAAAADAAAASLATVGSQNEEPYKKPNYVQISVDQYSHLTGLEDQVKTYEEQVKTLDDQITELNEKLTAAQTEMTNKDNLVKQHAKVAEEAVSGWEKAESEAVALKTHLESVTLAKLTVEDRASHLDGALKECMRQIRNLKEEHEQKLQDVILAKNKQCEKIKLELEAKLENLDQELRRSGAENAAISRSLQERSNMLMKISEEKSQAEADIEHLKGNIESCEREINSLKYELHVASKELEIRNEEKNMSIRSAEVANKQHMEGVKKIAKLEAECQRLRVLVRKKLPGAAALAQMKLEVESLGHESRDYGDSRVRRSPVKPASPHLSHVTEFSLDNVQKYQKENEFLTERLLGMEEETKMLKEALAKRNSELQASRSMCAKTASKLQSLEAQIQNSNQHKTSPKSIVPITTEGSFSQNASNPPSLTSMSEDGNDDDRSCAESWATALISELSHFKKDKDTEKSDQADKQNHLNLMDDFLEMEKLACLSNDSNGTISGSDSTNSKISEGVNHDASEVITGKDIHSEQQCNSNSLENQQPLSNVESSDEKQLPLMNLRSRISVLLESVSKETDVGTILEDIKCAIQETHDTLHQHAVSCVSEDVHCSDARSDRQVNPEDAGLTAEKEISLSQTARESEQISKDLAAAISQIHDFVTFLGKEAMVVHDTFTESDGFSKRIEDFSVTYNKVMHSNLSLLDFVLDLSRVLAKASELRFNVLGFKGNESETNSPDCIDKVALPENKVVLKDSNEVYQNGCAHISNSVSHPEIPDDGNIVSSYQSNTNSCKISVEEFEQLKSEKSNLALDLTRCTENLEMTKSQLQETEQLLSDAKSQLASVQNSNSLSETQLKCMAESYRSLETKAQELETELNLLRVKTESMETELQDEKKNHQDALARCKELQEQLQRKESSGDNEVDKSQEKELAAAAEKLAECQETIFLLGKQLKNMRPQPEFTGSPYSERSQKGEGEEEPTTSGLSLLECDQAESETAASATLNRVGAESPIDVYNSPCSPSHSDTNILKSPVNSKNAVHKSPKSGSSTSSSSATPEKHSRGFSRFFSSKGKNGH